MEAARRLSFRERRANRIGTGVSPTVVLALVGVAVFLLVGSLRSPIFAQQTVAGLAQGAIFASLALALVLIYRATEVINFAQGEMAMATTYFAYQLTLWHVSYWWAFFLTLIIAFFFGAIIQVALIRPVQHSVIAVVIVTVGLFVLIDGLVTWKWGADLKFMPAPFGNTVYHLGSVAFARQDIGTLLVTIVSVLLLWVLFKFTKLGLGDARRRAAAGLGGARRRAREPHARDRLGPRRRARRRGRADDGADGVPAADDDAGRPALRLRRRRPRRAREPRGRRDRRTPPRRLPQPHRLLLRRQYSHFATSELRLPIAFAVLLIVLLVKPHGLFGRKQVRRV